ncbi:collagen alpha-1(III) chain-like isoform X1 [Formica exsecta]|uniref:collagen alpha-1(III) chain-like isoform X1 n=1 Tax=Formica exsecta TaxID=72781 RepID=UPI001143EE26|nr:collagen alpha-1(III) chain-like isoform X1 [Formica exsecta]XP_029672526.1 collagen alpha-1(III) chain-like isoform X1 [Formica exsecta]
MTEIRPGCLKCSLTVALVVCTFFVGSGARANGGSSGAFASASAYAGAGASALSSASAFGGAGDFPGAYDGHKGIRSYDSISFSHDNDANRGTKSYGVVPGHGADGDGIKSSDHGYNKNDCSKCKWENDDYWEHDEPEEEGDENDGDECDDGQYRPDGTRHRGAGGPDRGHKSGSRPSGVHKTGPIDAYVDDGPKDGRPAGSIGGVNYPVPTTGYAAPTGGFATGNTPKPGSGWNTPFAYTTLKPGYAGATAGAYGTTSGSWPNWNRGTTPGGFASSSKPTWDSSGPAGNFVTTPKPRNWDIGSGAPTGGQPFSQKPWNTGFDNAPTASTSRPGQGWNTGFDNTPTTDFSQKPAPGWSTGRGPTGNFGVTPKSEPNGNSGFDSSSAGGLPFSRKPGGTPWNTGYDGTSFGTTPKPGQSWNAPSGGKPEPSSNLNYGTKSIGTTGCPRPDSSCTQGIQGPVKLGATPIDIDRTKSGESPSGISSAVSQTGSGISSPNSYGNPKENQNWPYGQPGTAQSTNAYAGASVTSGIGSTPHGEVPNFGKKDHPFFNKPAGTQTPYSGIDQAHPNTSGGTYSPGSVSDYNKPGRENTWPSNVANTFGTTKRPFGGNTFSSRKLPGSPIGSGVYDYPGVTKPSYGSGITSSSLNTGQPASGSSTWHSPGTTASHGFPGSTTGFDTTKSPFGHTNIPGPASLGSSYSGTGLKQPGFNGASSSASATAGAGAFGTFPSTPYITETTPRYEGALGYPGVKSSPGNTGSTYGIAPHGTHSYAGTGAWSGKQPGSGSQTWPGEQPGSGATSGVHLGTVTDTWPGKQPGGGSGPWPSKKPGDGSSTWPGGQPESVSATWPTRQPGSGTGSWPSGRPGDGSGVTPGRHPGTSDTWPGKQPGSSSGPWPSKKPGDGSSTWPGGQPGSVSATWPTRQPDSGVGSWPSGRPGDGSGVTPGGHPGTSDTWPGKLPGGSSGPWPSKKPGDGSSTWPGGQPGSVSATWPTRQPGSGTGSWPSGRPGDGSEVTPGGHPETSDTWPEKQSGGNNRPWPNVKPGDGSSTWPGGQPGSVSATWPTRHPDSGTGSWPSGKPEDGSSATSGSYPGVGSGIGPSKQPSDGNRAWPSKQPEDGSGTWPGISGCSSVNCGGSIGPYGESSNCGGGNYNCEGSCTGRDNNAPMTHGPCGETVSGPSGVNKTYYPAGTGDGHVPDIGNIYGSAPSFNSGIGAYPGTNRGCRSGDNSCNQGANVIPKGPVQWNSANPFLFGTGGGTPSDVSRPWKSETTVKPIGKGNPFLDPDWNRSPKPAYSNANNDKNVIPHGERNIKPIGQGNPFLDDNKRRGDIEVNPNRGVIPLGGRKPEEYNPFFGSGNSGSDGSSYTGGQPDGYPALGTPESGGVKGGSRGRVSPQQENSGGVYPTSGNSRGVDPLRCKLGIFGCGTPGSGSYETSSGKHPGGVFGGISGNVGTGGGNSGNVGSVPGTSSNTGTGITHGQFGAGHPTSAGSNLAGSLSGAYAGSFSNAQASNFPSAKSLPFSNTAGSGDDFGQARSGNWPSSGAQHQGGSNSWASSSAFASSNSGSWSGNYPTDVKG